MALIDRIIAEVRTDGLMPFERFMELALYDPADGFFGAGPLRSVKSGDFLTSPEVSSWFGKTLAVFVGERFERLGGSTTVVEAGAGSGSLLRPLAESVTPKPDRIVAIDASPAARTALADWGFETMSSLSELSEPFEGVILANELLDNLPMRLAARAGSAWEERWIDLVEDRLELVAASAREDTVEWLEAFAGPVPDGGFVEVQLQAASWLEEAIGLLSRGSIVIIDYGATAEELAPRRAIGTLRTYRSHHLGPDPLLEPGLTDITADVNFTALVETARQSAGSVSLHRQDDFLADLGLRQRIQELRATELELAKGDDAMARLQVRSELKDAETLLHPRGLGDFRVLVADVS